jgi:transcriptional regulator with XRE-family HTH domain
MTFHDKLQYLLRDMNRAAVCRRAGVSVNTVTGYLIRGHQPQIDAAVKLAKAFGVDPGWLIDPDRGLPPVRACEAEPAHAA